MNSTLPSLPSELISSWALWRHPRLETPLTPPMSTTFQRRRVQQVTTTLPPIAHLERHLSAMPPVTPPCDAYRTSPPRLHPPPFEFPRGLNKPSIPDDAPHLVDWLDFTRTRPAHFIAEKTCEMICYLWFSSPQNPYPSPNNSPTYSHEPHSSTSTLQLVASPVFVQFMQKLLETTQVSQSVIVLSLHYIYRLKERNRFTAGQAGSEFRIAVAALMMANKFLDDNTYTNKTWSEVSGIELVEINKMEREFLVGVDFGLYVDKATYESWLNLLKGLVMAKERDSRRWKSRSAMRSSRLPNPRSTHTASTRKPSRPHRARSTSPSHSRSQVYAIPQSHPANPEPASPTPRSGSKRSAAVAFSPTSATFAHLPTKRPMSMSLHIPELAPSGNSGPSSYSPLEGLQSFSKMTLAHSPHVATPPTDRSLPAPSSWVSSAQPSTTPHTLVTAYSADEGRRTAVPQNLYFYALACSPMDNEEENRSRKARLRYHQPPPPSLSYPPQRSIPLNVQSASTSPHDLHSNLPLTLPHFHDTVWTRQNCVAPLSRPAYDSPQQADVYSSAPSHEFHESAVRSAPFANAGPPGVQFYSTPTQQPADSFVWGRRR